jgi:phosphoglycerol transferase MdoB-like AlkP superfamily enzyme
MILLTALLFTGARGTGVKPLRIISAARYASSQEIPLLINTPFSVLHTIQEKNNIARNYFPDGSYRQIYSPLQQYKLIQKNNDNVVILILESFSHEFIGTLSGKKTYTPFLDSLLNQSLLFENGFANCRKSIEAIPAILAGLPSLTNNSYISSRYAGNRLKALPYILGKHGYNTAFFHGGRNGTMSFNEFAKVAGVKHYYGMNEYEGPEAFDKNWGIYDNEFLQYTVKEMNRLPEPFFTTIYTLSSHHPYTIPKEFEVLIPKDESPQLRAIRYADMALRNYFKTAEKQPWFKNTLFVVVADHTAKVVDSDYNNPVGTFRIPIAYYHPGNDSLKGRRKDISQQTDIMPSVIHYLGIEENFLAYGSSVFETAREPFAINYLNSMFYYFKDNFILTFDGESPNSLFNFANDKNLRNNLITQKSDTLKLLEKKLKATIQDYQLRLENNKLTYN